MAVHLFNKSAFSLTYQKYMIPVSSEITNIVLSYVKAKSNGRPLEMAVDVGCGTGRYTLPLAPHFKKVLGLDISDSQISVAKQISLAKNVSYMVAPAEKLPLKDASVDLVHAGLAAHWFTIDKFVNEANRVLKTGGCLAVHSFEPFPDFEYNNSSHKMNEVMSEVWDVLYQYFDNVTHDMFYQYQYIYDAIPLKDKERITDVCDKIQLSIPEMIGFIQAIYMFERFKEKDVKGAEKLLMQTEKRFREILGENADSDCLNMHMKYYCVLARKH
ncbi:putative methyltransferase [Anomaloglossus baeobatrachus]|uniref:putative methyltransferase DDB_G0268948 n=1 Tax=Anomaloglossus baeobatrachus TaxID=238106 RepID=UPI003F4F73AF